LDLIAAILFAARPKKILWLKFIELNPFGQSK